ncbi:MAG: aldolase [Acidimicrobiia bacterium]|nr:MAG: aldolase [Acidimicrobiia bacterium]
MTNGSVAAEFADRVAGSLPSPPREAPPGQPVHTVYGGAHLFRADTAQKLGEVASRTLERYAPRPADLAEALGLEEADDLYRRVVAKLQTEPVEDYRIDFEDGYGVRSDEEEDGHARTVVEELARGMADQTLPRMVGIRIKPLTSDLYRRSLRTLELVVTGLLEKAGALPGGFVVTVPKVRHPDQVAILVEFLGRLEEAAGSSVGRIPVEVMVETPETVVAPDGSVGVRRFVEAGDGRVRGAHFGTYDYTAACGITAPHQTMDHPVCDFARHVLQVSLAGTGVWLSDGATNVMPVPVHRGDDLTEEQIAENRRVVHSAWRIHFEHIRRSLYLGYYQGWDLHPGQLPSRFAAVIGFFREGLDQTAARLSNFVEQAARATLVGEVFDDAATGQGLLNHFLRAIDCGAVTEEEATRLTGLTIEELRLGSFTRILAGRR